jgi:rhodanese-related sulfurtransferase
MVQYISPQQLEALIKSKSNDFLIIDVRDDDYRGGNIKGGINIPSEQFQRKLHQLIDDTQNVSKIIFHCAYSQQRWVYPVYILSKSSSSPLQKRSEGCTGRHPPTPAQARSLRPLDQMYTQARLLQEGGTDINYEVYVLQGGFADFQRLFKVSKPTNHPAHFFLPQTSCFFSMIQN